MDRSGEQEVLHRTYDRPLEEGLLQIAAADAITPGEGYAQFRSWARDNGLCGHEEGLPYPNWRNGVYISTSITSGGEARRPGLTVPEAARANTALSSSLTMQVVRDNGLDPADILLSTDLPHVRGWAQSDYLLFWLANMAGMPLDFQGDIAASLIDDLARSPIAAAVNESGLNTEERWVRYKALVDNFDQACRDIWLYNRNDYQLAARPGRVLQLVDTELSLGCRAEEYYARLRGIELARLVVQPELIDDQGLRQSLADVSMLGAQVGIVDQGTFVIPVGWGRLRGPR